MKGFIFVIEDRDEHFDNISLTLSDYSAHLEVFNFEDFDSLELKYNRDDFISDIRIVIKKDSNSKKECEVKIIKLFSLLPNIKLFIIDYHLKEKNNNNEFNGVKVYDYFLRHTFKDIPILFLTKDPKAAEHIVGYSKKHNLNFDYLSKDTFFNSHEKDTIFAKIDNLMDNEKKNRDGLVIEGNIGDGNNLNIMWHSKDSKQNITISEVDAQKLIDSIKSDLIKVNHQFKDEILSEIKKYEEAKTQGRDINSRFITIISLVKEIGISLFSDITANLITSYLPK